MGKYLIRKLGPFSVLFSSYAHGHETNSIVESHNKVIKQDILSCSNLKPSRVVKSLRCDVLASLVKIHASPKFEKVVKKKQVKDPQEKFKGGIGPKITNFEKAQIEGNKYCDKFSKFDVGKINEVNDNFNLKYKHSFFQLKFLELRFLCAI